MPEWITPITNRNAYDVYSAKQYIERMKGKSGTLTDMRGCLNASDLNRIEGNIEYLLDRGGVSYNRQTWSVGDIPTASDKSRILSGINAIVVLYNMQSTIPSNILTFQNVNAIEQICLDASQIEPPSIQMMPHLDGVLSYFDSDDGIGREGYTHDIWVNRIQGGGNMQLWNVGIAADGALDFRPNTGNYSGNGKFSCNTTESATMYVLFKRDGTSIIDNYIHICGSVANGENFPYVGASESYWKYGVQFMLNNNAYVDTGLFQFDITNDAIRDMSLSCLDYHVVCCVRQKNGAVYDNIMYVDGSLIGRIDGTPYPPGTNYGVCIGVDSFGYEDATFDGYDTLIKMIAVGNQAHTAQQVAENSAWLLNHFNIE